MRTSIILLRDFPNTIGIDQMRKIHLENFCQSLFDCEKGNYEAENSTTNLITGRQHLNQTEVSSLVLFAKFSLCHIS